MDNKTFEITRIAKGEETGVINLGTQIWNNAQACLYITWDHHAGRILKLLQGDWFEVHKATLDDCWTDISDFHLGVLSAVEQAGVVFPKYWNIVEWILDDEKRHGFIQSNLWSDTAWYEWGWDLPNIWQKDTIFIDGWNRRSDDGREFLWRPKLGKSIFFDWDTYLTRVLSGKRDDESLEDLYARIANTKLD